MKERLHWIDIAKGISIIAVIIGHSNITIFDFKISNFLYPFHLMVFFILSGYTLKKEKITKEYLNKKFSRLMKPYFLTCFFIILMDMINAVIQHKHSIISITKILGDDLIRSFFASGTIKTFGTIDIGTRIGAIWFLPALFFAIIIVQLILNYISSNEYRLVASFIILIIGYISSDFIWYPFSIQSAMICQSFVLLGYYFHKYNIFEKIQNWHYIFFGGDIFLGFLMDMQILIS